MSLIIVSYAAYPIRIIMRIEENIEKAVRQRIEDYNVEIESVKTNLGTQHPTSPRAKNLADQLADLLAKRDALSKFEDRDYNF